MVSLESRGWCAVIKAGDQGRERNMAVNKGAEVSPVLNNEQIVNDLWNLYLFFLL